VAFVVYTNARLRKIPFCTFDPIFRVLLMRGIVLFAPYIHTVLRRRGNAWLDMKLGMQGATGGVG